MFKRRNGFNTWFTWPILTLGIYSLVWYYKINRELRDSGVNVDPAMAVIAITLGGLILVPPFVSIFKTGERIREAQHRAGQHADCSGGIGFLLIFVFGLYPWYYQAKLNKLSVDE